jgi:hypothetical protein
MGPALIAGGCVHEDPALAAINRRRALEHAQLVGAVHSAAGDVQRALAALVAR